MNVMSNGLKTRFAGLLRELLRRCDENGSQAVIPQSYQRTAPATPLVATLAPVQPPAPRARPSVQQPAAPAAPALKPVAAPASVHKPAQIENTTDLELPLQLVLETLPLELRSKMSAKNVDFSRASISIALKKIRPQLSLGVIRITFGELRRAAPSLFNVQDEYDSLPVVLPLNEVLARLSSSLLSRNPVRKTVEVPAEITGPFGGRGHGIAISATPAKSPKPSSTPPVQMNALMTTAPAQFRSPPIAPIPMPVMPRQITPAPGAASAPHSGNGADNGTITKPAIPTVPVQSITPSVPAPPVMPVAPIPMPAATPTPVMSVQAAAMVPLAALSEKWPDVAAIGNRSADFGKRPSRVACKFNGTGH